MGMLSYSSHSVRVQGGGLVCSPLTTKAGGMPKRLALLSTLCLLVFLIAGCAATPKMRVSDHIYGYSLEKVEVAVDQDAHTGVFERMDNIDDEEFARELEQKLEKELVAGIAPLFSGKMPARVLVHVDEMNIASGIGRALLGSSSFIGAQVSIVDVSTGEILLEKHFREQEKDVSFSGNIGGLIELTKNVVDAAVNDRVEEATREFAERVRKWLDS